MERREKKWWGWGFLDKRYPLEERPNFWTAGGEANVRLWPC